MHSPHLPSPLQGNADLWDWVGPPGIQALKSILGSLEDPGSYGSPGSTGKAGDGLEPEGFFLASLVAVGYPAPDS